MPDDTTTITVFDAVRALAFIGDLSMGQPTDHSLRTAWLAGKSSCVAMVFHAATPSRTCLICAACAPWSLAS